MRPLLRAALCWFSCLAMQTAQAQVTDADLAAARAGMTSAFGDISTENAKATVPGHTANPPQTAHANRDLRALAHAHRIGCAGKTNDPACEANTASMAFAEAPRPDLGISATAVGDAAAVARAPGAQIEGLSSIYSGCASDGSCPADVYCLGETCFNTSSVPDPDFAEAMTYLEAGRQAGVYLDTTNLRVFSGEWDVCSQRPWKDCCSANNAGKGMTNQSLYGSGTKLVYDTFMNEKNRQFVVQGLKALMTNAGMTGSFTSYGFTVAAVGTPLPAGSVVLLKGNSFVFGFDPVTLAIAVVIYVVMQMMSCEATEGKLAMKEGAALCHSVGRYCSRCLMVLGKCVSCTEHSIGKCCFNSVLARLINQQGRAQLGLDWGSAERPNCEGFTIDQLQRLDFSRMDLSEFYASIAPTMPDAAALGAKAAGNAATNCYYGKGKCGP